MTNARSGRLVFYRMIKLIVVVLLVVTVGTATAAELGIVYDPPATDEARVDGDMDAIARLGLTWVRIVPDWTLQEPAAGQYDWRFSDHLVRAARAHHMHLVYTLGYTPQWASLYPTDPDPDVWNRNRPKDVEVWKRYVSAVVARYGKDVSVWQVWERPDIYRFRGSDQDLRALLLSASQAIHKRQPDARLLCPEVGQIDLGSIERMYRHGLAGAFDILGSYPDRAHPEDVVRPLDTLQDRIVTKQGPACQIWFDGLAWNDAAMAAVMRIAVVSDDEQAQDLVRSVVLALSHHVDTVLWRGWRDRPDGPLAVQTRSGLTNADGTLRPAGVAYRTVVQELATRPYRQALSTPPHVWAYRFGQDGDGVVVAWTDGPPVPCVVPKGVQTRDEAGQPSPPSALTGAPVFMQGPDAMLQQVSWGHSILAAPPDYRTAADVHVRLSAHPEESGLYVHPYGLQAVAADQGGEACWRTDVANHLDQIRFDVDDSYLYFVNGETGVDVDVEVWGNTGTQPMGFNLGYDGVSGFTFTHWQGVDAGAGWKRYTFHLTDAQFSDPWSDFRINALGSRSDLYVRSVTVRREGPVMSRP